MPPLVLVVAGLIFCALGNAFVSPFTQAGPTTINMGLYYANGAVNKVLINPASNNIMYAAAVAGGIWKTSNANAVSPSWTLLTDGASPCTFFSDIEFDVQDPTFSRICASCADRSAFESDSGIMWGIICSSDGGNTWSQLGASSLVGHRAVSLFVSGSTILVGVDDAWAFGSGYPGAPYGNLYTSTDGGSTFFNASFTWPVQDITNMPGSSVVLVTSVYLGVSISYNNGVNWTSITPSNWPAYPAYFNAKYQARFANWISRGGCNSILVEYRSPSGSGMQLWTYNNCSGWTGPVSAPFGLYDADMQTELHGASYQDPSTGYVVISGDSTDNSPYYVPIFYADITLSSPVWTSLTSYYSAPHPDSRFITADSNGYLIVCTDGGIYRCQTANPWSSSTIYWGYIGGNIIATELFSAHWEPLFGVPFGGSQDNGSPFLINSTTPTAQDITGGDGQLVGVDTTGYSYYVIIYACAENWHCRSWNITRCPSWPQGPIPTQIMAPPINPSTGVALNNFREIFAVNRVQSNTVAAIDLSYIYESKNLGGVTSSSWSASSVSSIFLNLGQSDVTFVYGGMLNGVNYNGFILIPMNDTLWIRSDFGQPFKPVAAFNARIAEVEVPLQNWNNAYLLQTSEAEGSFNNVYQIANLSSILTGTIAPQVSIITGNLGTVLSPYWSLSGFTLTTIEVVPMLPSGYFILVGSKVGIFYTNTSSLGTWQQLSFPSCTVRDISYEPADDTLVVATQGYGFFVLKSASHVLSGQAPVPRPAFPVCPSSTSSPSGGPSGTGSGSSSSFDVNFYSFNIVLALVLYFTL